MELMLYIKLINYSINIKIVLIIDGLFYSYLIRCKFKIKE
jgi:hypothetical protein